MDEVRQLYRLRIADIPGRRFEIRLQIESLQTGTLRLRMPAWVPGSYLVREYAGHVVDLHANSNGRPLAVRKEDKATWTIDTGAETRCEIAYRVYAPELTVRTSDISESHAFVHPPSCFLEVVGRRDEPHGLIVEPPDGWSVATVLEQRNGTFLAADYDRLLDCPLEIGPASVHRFEAAGKPHELVIHGTGNHDLARMLEDMRKICEHEIAMMGGAPYERYLFILHLSHDKGGGLEHADSSVLAWPKLKFRPEKEYRKFLTLVAHEFFHVWNVKRIRPEVLLRYDYSKETYTRLLWVFEGITSYYDELVPMRSGCYTPRDYFELLAERVRAENSRPGRMIQSLTESSFDTWIKLYRPTPDSPNSQVNYYEKGMLVALLLDLHLRRHSAGSRSLDDVMRHLWNEVYLRGRGVEEGAFAELVREAAEVDVGEFLTRHVESTGALDFGPPLAEVGLQIRPKAAENGPKAWLGAAIDNGEQGSRLSFVLHGGPAHTAGMMAGDEIIALDGHRVGRDLEERIGLHRPGETASWNAFRRDRLVGGEIEFREDPNPALEIKPLDESSAAQRKAFESWTQCRWEKAWQDPQAADGSTPR